LIQLIPRGIFTRTLGGDLRELMRQADDLVGGRFTTVTRFFQFMAIDIIEYDSAVEAAIKKIRRLLPTVWVTGGFDIQTINRFFSIKTLKEFGAAFTLLAQALKDNGRSIFVVLDDSMRKFEYGFQRTLKYVHAIPDTVLSFQVKDIGAAIYSVSELLRGVLNIKLTWLDVGKLMREIFNSAYIRFIITIEDIITKLPMKLANALVEGVKSLPRVLSYLAQIIKDFFRTNDLEIALNPFRLLSRGYNAFAGMLSNLKDFIFDFTQDASGTWEQFVESFKENKIVIYLQQGLAGIKAFAEKVIHFFYRIYDEVIGHSWWTDTIETIVDTSKSLLARTKGSLSAFGDFVLKLFQKINTSLLKNSMNGVFKTVLADSKPLANSLEKVMQFDGNAMSKSMGLDSGVTGDIITQMILMFKQLAIIAIGAVASIILAVKRLGAALTGIKNDVTNFWKDAWGNFSEIASSDTASAFEKVKAGLVLVSESILNIFLAVLKQINKALAKVFLQSLAVLAEDNSGISKLLGKYMKGFAKRKIQLFFDPDATSLQKVIASLETFFAAVAIVAAAGVISAINFVKRFGENVINIFKNIYDEVIGHSWWTDTIDAVVNTSATLGDRVLNNLRKLLSFKGILGEVFGKSNKGIQANGFVSQIGKVLTTLKEKASEVLVTITRRVVGTMSAMIGQLLIHFFRGSTLTEALGRTMFTTFLFLGVHLVKFLGEFFLKNDFSPELGKMIGGNLATYLNGVLKSIPGLLKDTLGLISGVIIGFLSNLAIIGPVFKKIFEIADFAGLSKAISLIAVGFAAWKLKDILKGIEKVGQAVDWITKHFAQLRILSAGLANGVIGSFLFGTIGMARGIALLAGIGDVFGIFDSVSFSDCLFTKIYTKIIKTFCYICLSGAC
jgi:hypothetical protein